VFSLAFNTASMLKKISPEWSLRLTLGLMYLYSGIDLIRHPTAWHWAIPYWLKQLVSSVLPLNTYLALQGGIEILFALVFFAWFLNLKVVKLTALLASIEFLVILILAFLPWSEANFLITFRDIGLLGASSALYLLLVRRPNTKDIASP
jgi:hypothetical protein